MSSAPIPPQKNTNSDGATSQNYSEPESAHHGVKSYGKHEIMTPPASDPGMPRTIPRGNPPIDIKCGPMIRYWGMNDIRPNVWRGSVLIVTQDSTSDYSSVPVLTISVEELRSNATQSTGEERSTVPDAPQQPASQSGAGNGLVTNEAVDSQDKSQSRSETRPQTTAEPTGTGNDIAAVHGAVESLPKAGVVGHGADATDFTHNDQLPSSQPTTTQSANVAFKAQPSEDTNYEQTSAPEALEEPEKYTAKAKRYFQEYGVSFWRFDVELPMGAYEKAVSYYINNDDLFTNKFYVPARTQNMNVMFYSCNGFSISVDPSDFKGYLWQDVLRHHENSHYHVMLGGGDQIYCDKVKISTKAIKLWTRELNVHKKRHLEFTDENRVEVENFYLWHYIGWFGLGYLSLPEGALHDKHFLQAQASIPQINIYDDHDIIDGYGSYTDKTMSSPYMIGIGKAAYKYYALFQQGVAPDDSDFTAQEPSYVIGKSMGKYMGKPSLSVYARAGPSVAFYGLDCRTERTHELICSQSTYDAMFRRLSLELDAAKGEIKHLLLMLGVPIAYPRLVWLERILTSRAIAPVRALARHGFMVGLNNGFDDKIEILDDLEDHWCAKYHKAERNQFMARLQEFAHQRNIRITMLSGDVHLAGIGRFYGVQKSGGEPLPVESDPCHMLNVISSAITNTPPPVKMADFLNKRTKIHHLSPTVDEDMVRVFNVDVDGSKRNNTHLLPRRNWCSIAVQSDKTSANKDLVPGQAAFKNLTSSSERLYKDMPGALNIVLHMEKDPQNLEGTTVPYDIIVPQLKSRTHV